MKNKYTVDYFIRKFKAIPERFWTSGVYVQGCKKCALGHLGEQGNGSTTASEAFKKLFTDHGLGVVTTNDYPLGRFRQATPKSRILAALDYIKKNL